MYSVKWYVWDLTYSLYSSSCHVVLLLVLVVGRFMCCLVGFCLAVKYTNLWSLSLSSLTLQILTLHVGLAWSWVLRLALALGPKSLLTSLLIIGCSCCCCNYWRHWHWHGIAQWITIRYVFLRWPIMPCDTAIYCSDVTSSVLSKVMDRSYSTTNIIIKGLHSYFVHAFIHNK